MERRSLNNCEDFLSRCSTRSLFREFFLGEKGHGSAVSADDDSLLFIYCFYARDKQDKIKIAPISQ